MKTNLLISLTILIVFSSCNTKRKSDVIYQQPSFPIKIDLIKAMANPKDIKLSDIADSIVYIPLEYVKDNPVGYIGNYKYFSDNIFIHIYGSEQKFLRFSGKGKFLNKIGTMGRGPGEFPGGSSFSASDNPERFYILCNFVPRRLLEFDFNGNYLSNVLTANPPVGSFEAISNERFLFLGRSDTSFRYLAVLGDRNNNPLDFVPHPLLSNPKLKELTQFDYAGARSGVYFNKKPLFWDELSVDTIYAASDDSIYTKYILDKGHEGAPFEKAYAQKTTLDPHTTPERWNYLLPFGFTETFHDVFILAMFKNKELYLINYNKASMSLSSMKTPLILPANSKESPTKYPSFENDIDGGISFGLGKPNREGDVWTYKYDAIQFKNLLTKDHFVKSEAQYPEKKRALIQLVDSIKEEDNPIIMVVYLKKPIK
jgi:hypothetical protein